MSDTLGLPPTSSSSDVDLELPDLEELARVRPLVEIPDGWDIFALHALELELMLPQSLPCLWDRTEEEHHERIRVRTPQPLIEVPQNPECGSIAYAMPEKSGFKFAKWLVGQVFLNSNTGGYIEPRLYSSSVPRGKVRHVYVAGMETPHGSVRVLEPILLPAEFALFPADPAVIRRAEAALGDPSNIVDPNLYDTPMEAPPLPDDLQPLTPDGWRKLL